MPQLPDDPLLRRVLLALLGMQRQSWEQGVLGHALLDLGCDELAEVVARDSVLRQTPAGKLAEIEDTGVVNCGAAGEALLWLTTRDHDPALRAALDRQVDWLVSRAPRAEDGTLFHLEGSRQVWVDTVYMVLPLLVQTGHVDEAARQLDGHRRRLFDETSGLWSHQWGETSRSLLRAAHWGSGSGWVVAGIARALRSLGERDGRFRADAASHARTVLDACLAHRRADTGVFLDVVDGEGSFAEANLAQMLAYGAFTGVADGWLPDAYLERARSLLASARERVDALGFVDGVSGAPHFDRPGRSAEAQAFHLLAAAAEQRCGRLAG
ncbi:glycoside hydrolase family 88 protein [Motilibacter peucedani]|uniref:glycoside hydrolase family 88 protein n=1 Tax=Motilibacter peucedani TaxID=598650 RepID=UPI001E5202DA|nr:glycoside hydrolase family 88 protein [Motilibacter peucedani]